jgi:hypothetical protein
MDRLIEIADQAMYAVKHAGKLTGAGRPVAA